jgi:plastocyanin
MKNLRESISTRIVSIAVAALMAGVTAGAASAAQWMAWAGVQSPDLGSQVLAFLPNEFWIHAGDSIRWTHPSDEIHTVTFLKPGQVRPANFGPTFGVPVGCPGNTPDGAIFDGSSCVNSGLLGPGPINVGPVIQTYSVTFPSPGNFKLVCLVHPDMTGTIHVLNQSATLPHNQAFYNDQAANQRATLVAATSSLRGFANSENEDEEEGQLSDVTAGVGAVLTTTGAGAQTLSLSRFLQDVVVVRVGDTVEWTNRDPATPHTVTFGTEPADPRPPSLNVSSTVDGARQAVIGSTADSANSGLLVFAPQDRAGLPQAPQGVTRFRVTFTAPGTFNYICSLHDNLGMKGKVIVH